MHLRDAYACPLQTLSKLLSVGVGVWLMWLRWDVMPTWTRVVYPLCWVAMSVLQVRPNQATHACMPRCFAD